MDGWIVIFNIWTCVILFLLRVCSGQTSPSSVSPTASGTSGEITTDGDVSSLAQGVQPLYQMTNVFLGNVVQPQSANDYFNISEIINAQVFADFWKPLSGHFVGFVVCGVIGILFIILVPLVGLIFCCCRCCGRCGGKAGSHDPKYAKCKRITYGTILTVITTLIMAAVVCMFFTNELIHKQLSNEENGAFSKVQSSITKLEKYINDSYGGLRTSTLYAYDVKIWSPNPSPLTGELINQINSTASMAVGELLAEANVTEALDKARDLSREVNRTLDSLDNVETSVGNLTSLGNELYDQLIQIKADIINVLQDSGKCPDNICKHPLTVVKSLQIQANFSQLDQLQTMSKKVKEQVNVQEGILEAEDTINSIKTSAQGEVKKQVDQSVQIASDVRNQIASALSSIENSLQQAKLPPDTQTSINDAKSVSKQVGNYWWYGGIAVSCVVLLIVVFNYFGLLYGFCGERPGEDAQCCNWGVGANLLMAGVGFSFIFSWLLMIVVIVLFIPGGVTYTELCRHLNSHDPQQLRFLDPVTEIIGLDKLLNNTETNLTLADVLNDCKENKGIYEALNLQNVFDVKQYLNLSNIDGILDEISKVNIAIDNLTVPDSLMQGLLKFGDVGFEKINISEYKEQINKNLTSVDLKELAKLIEAVGNDLAKSEPVSDTGPNHHLQGNNTLHEQARKLREVADTTVVQMKAQVVILDNAVNDLANKLDMKNVTQALISAIERAQQEFNTNGKNKLKNVLPKEAERVKQSVKSFTSQVTQEITEDVGQCKPVYDALYDASDAVCMDILNPLNGFWFSLGWCLFFLIPSIIFAVKLTGLNRKEDEYVAGIRNVEEPAPDIYSNGETHSDTIPLTSKYNWQ